jgi:D-lactate dehydrogenase (cytochrome)
MPTNVIKCEDILSTEEIAAIDSFAAANAGLASLPEWGVFLTEKFCLELAADPDIVQGFVNDSSNLPGAAGGVLRPVSERECAAAFRACFKAGIPYTLSAGRSNLTGSATPDGGVIISLSKMTEPEVTVDVETKTVRANIAVIVEDLRNAVLKQSGKKLVFPVDPTSRADAAVGGALACNASGFVPGESGAIRDWVQAIDFLLPDGKKLTASRGQYVSQAGKFILQQNGATVEWPVPTHPRVAIKNAGGPYSSEDGAVDLIDLIVGSEGLFGAVTACTLKLADRPDDYLDLFFSLPGEAEAVKLRDAVYAKLDGDLGKLSALEYFGVNCRQYMDHEERLFLGNNQVAIYLQVPLFGVDAEEAAEAWFEFLLEADCGIDEDAVMLLDNDRDRAVFMEARHSLPANALEVVQHRGTYTIMTDMVVPAEKFPDFLDYTHNLINAEKMDYLSFGHFGDCHLHFTILPEKAQLDRAVEIYDQIVAKSAELGGVYSGEHGTGKRKRKDFLACHGQAGVDAVAACKAAIDPQFLLNRGNVLEAPRHVMV